MRAIVCCLLVSLAAACATSRPTGTPDEMANEIAAALAVGDAAHADDLFRQIRKKSEYREKVYPVVYTAARERFEVGDSTASVEMLRFLARAYPDATSVREGLVYGLFVERARTNDPDPALVRELGETSAELRSRMASPPVWIDLVDAQVAIDQGRLEEARNAYDRFLGAWNGNPASMTVYVEDVGRWLATH